MVNGFNLLSGYKYERACPNDVWVTVVIAVVFLFLFKALSKSIFIGRNHIWDMFLKYPFNLPFSFPNSAM